MKTIFNLIPIILIGLILNYSIKEKRAEIAAKDVCIEWQEDNPYASLDPDAVILLTKIIRAESIGESKLDKEWQGSVVLNRMKHSEFPETMWSVVYQKRQFSGVNEPMFEYTVREDTLLKKLDLDCRYVAMDLLLNGSKLPDDVLFYHNPGKATATKWVANVERNMDYYGTTGKHKYYRI